MKDKRSLRETIQQFSLRRGYVKPLTIVACAWTVASLIVLYMWYEIKPGATPADSRNFDLSFLASAAEDLAFFLLVGIGTFVLSLRKPQDDELEARIGYVFSNRAQSDAAFAFVKEQVTKLASVQTHAQFDFHVKRYVPEYDAYWVEVSNTHTVQNLMADVDYHDPNFEICVYPDVIETPDRILGEVTLIRLTPERGKPKDFLDCAHTITYADKIFRKPIDIMIDKNGRTTYELKYAGWCKVGECFHNEVRRFSENSNIRITNHTDKIIDVYRDEQKLDKIQIKPNDTCTISKEITMFPGKGHKFWW